VLRYWGWCYGNGGWGLIWVLFGGGGVGTKYVGWCFII